MRKILIVLAAATCGCFTLSPGGRKVVLVEDVTRVQPCRSVGQVSASPPYMWPDDWKTKLRNNAAERGADTVYTKTPGISFGSIEGEAFVCASAFGPR